MTFLNEALKKEKSDTTKSATAAEHRELAISVMLLEIEKYQKTCSYAFDANAPLLMSIKCFKFDTEVENEFYNISYTLEPRQNKQLQTSDQQQQSHSKGNSNENAKWDIMHHLRDLSVTKTMTNAQTSSSSTSPSPYSYTSLKRNQKSAGVISAPTSPAKGNVWVAEPTETSLTNNTADNNNSTFEKSLIRRRKNSEKRKGKKSLFENDSDDTSSSTSGNSQLQQQHQRAKSSSASITSPPKKTSGSQKATITMKSLAGRFRSGSVNREGGAAVLDKQLKILTNKPNSGNNSNNTAPVTMSISPAPLEGFDIGSAFPSYSSDNTGSRITPDAIASSENAIASDDSEYETEEDSIEDDDLMARSAGEDGMPEAPELEGILWEKRLKSDGESGLSFNPKYKWKKKIVVYDDGILTVGKYSKKKLKLLRETYAQAPSYNHTPSSSGEKGSSATNEDLIIVESVEEMDGMGSTSLLEIPAGPTKKLEKFFSTTSLKSVDMSTSVTSAGRDNELQLPEGSDASTSDFNTHQHGLHRLSLDAGGGSRLQKHRSHSSLVGSDGGAHSSRHRGLLSLVNLPSIVTTHNYGNGATTADSRLTKSMGFGRKNGSFHGAGNYGGEESPTGRKRFDILLRRKSAQSIETGGLHQAHPSATTTALQQNLAIISSSSSSSSSHLLQHHPTLPLIADPKRSGHLFGFGSLAGLSEEIRKRAGSFDELKKSGSSTSPFKKTSSESSMPSEKVRGSELFKVV